MHQYHGILVLTYILSNCAHTCLGPGRDIRLTHPRVGRRLPDRQPLRRQPHCIRRRHSLRRLSYPCLVL
jgi:hypothetical protein